MANENTVKTNKKNSAEWQVAISNNDTKKMQELINAGIRATKEELRMVAGKPTMYRLVYASMTGNTLSKDITAEVRKEADNALKNKSKKDSKIPQKPRKGYAIKVCGKDITETSKYKEVSRKWYDRTRVF